MKQKNTLEGLLQGSSENHEKLFREYIRGQIRLALSDMMQEEVHDLCGPKYRPRFDAAHRRRGSDRGTLYLGGKRQRIMRPRVRHLDEDGQDHGEVKLRTYHTARRLRGIEADLVDFIAHGASTRSFTRMKLDGMSRSEVSRRWVNRVCRWQTQTDQVSRWTAAALLWAEAGFRKITGYKDLPKLLAAMGFPPDPPFRPPWLPRRCRASPATGLSRPLLTHPGSEVETFPCTIFAPRGDGGQKR